MLKLWHSLQQSIKPQLSILKNLDDLFCSALQSPMPEAKHP
ncbi:hypothetical protein OF001_U80027 [Pseudomonas sp. OF001]|nr:hypothetical protein OF001_U80027 [Pseudomonas sp. OF001]